MPLNACNGCKELYIGQTGDKLRTRRTIHAQQIRDPSTRQIPLSEHIDNCSRSIPKGEVSYAPTHRFSSSFTW